MIRKYKRGYPQFSKHWNEWSDLCCFGKLFNEILSKHDKLLVNKLRKKAEKKRLMGFNKPSHAMNLILIKLYVLADTHLGNLFIGENYATTIFR